MTTTTELETLVVKLVGEDSGYQEMLDEVVEETEEAAKDIKKELEDISRSLTSMGTKLTVGVTLPIIGFAAGALKAASDIEQLQVQFSTMLGSATKARDLMADLRGMAAETPFTTSQLASSTRTLVAFGVELNDVQQTMRMLGDVSAGTGKDLRELSVIYGQIRGMGRLQGQDFLQLVNAGFPVAEIAKTLGTDMKGLRAEMERGNVSFRVVEETFRRLTAEGGMYGGMMEELSQTLAGRLSTLWDNVTQLSAELGGELLPMVKALLESLIEWVKWMKELPDWVKTTAVALGALAAAAGPVLLVAGKLVGVLGSLGALTSGTAAIGGYAAAWASVTTALSATAVAIAPVAAAVGALAAIAATVAVPAWIVYKKYVTEVNAALAEVVYEQKQVASNMQAGFNTDIARIRSQSTAGEARAASNPAISEAWQTAELLNAEINRVLVKMEELKRQGKTGLDIEFRAAAAELEGLTAQQEVALQAIQDLRDLREELADLPADAPPDPQLVAGVRAYVAELEKQRKTLGMTKEELVEYEYAQKNIGATLMGEVKAAHEAMAKAKAEHAEAERQLAEQEARRQELLGLRQELEAAFGAGSGPGGVEGAVADLLADHAKAMEAQQAAQQAVASMQQQLEAGADRLRLKLERPWQRAGRALGSYTEMLRQGLITQREYRMAVDQVAQGFQHTLQSAKELDGFINNTRKFDASMVGITGGAGTVFDVEGMRAAAMGGRHHARRLQAEREDAERRAAQGPGKGLEERFRLTIAAINEVVAAIEQQQQQEPPDVVESLGIE